MTRASSAPPQRESVGADETDWRALRATSSVIRMNTAARGARTPGTAAGLIFALLSALSFGTSGTLARGLLDIGWTAGSATLARVTIAGLILSIPAAAALRGNWGVLRRAWPTIVAYGIFAVAFAQFFYFLAVGTLDVSVALLIEYTAPLIVVLWMWLRHGNRPSALTFAGGAVAILGLILLLDVLGGGGGADTQGVFFALLAMVGAAAYFILSGKPDTGLPPVALAAGGLLVAAAILGLLSLIGIIPTAFATGTVQFVPFALQWWAAVLLLGVVAAAVAYTTGIVAARLLGSRLASFVALSEVVAAAVFAWVLLGQSMGPVQLGGAVLVLAGVLLVKLGEPKDASLEEVADLLEPLPSDPSPAD